MASYLIAFLIACATSLLLTRCVREWARKRGLIDRPDSRRKLHTTGVPRIGGVAVYLSILIALGLVSLLPTETAGFFRYHIARAATILALAGLMMLIGLWDDLRNLSPWTKFGAQIILALACWAFGLQILGGWNTSGGVFQWGILSLPLTVLWIVGITNAFNMLDGIDGLSAGASLFATLAMIVVSIANQQYLAILLLAALAGATLGFLRHNFNPASIFLGDSGSLLLGFTLALLSIECAQKSTTAFAIALPVVAFGLPVLDTCMVVLRRFLSGKPLFLGDRRHIHHVLMERGLKPRHVAILLYAVCGLFGLFSLLFMNPSGKQVGFAMAVLGAAVWFGIQQLHYPELRELNGYLARSIQHQRQLITGNVNIGRMLDGFRSATKLSDVLESLSTLLGEMEFSRAEVRLPSLNQNRLVLRARDWSAVCDGRTHCLYQWFAPDRKPAKRKVAAASPAEEATKASLGNDFRIEFVFQVPRVGDGAEESAAETSGEVNRGDIGRLTFFHPADVEYPASAICLLSRDVWKEFGEAIGRLMLQPNAGHVDDGVEREPVVAANRLTAQIPAVARVYSSRSLPSGA